MGGWIVSLCWVPEQLSTLLEMIRGWWHVSPPLSPPNIRETSSSSFSLSPLSAGTEAPFGTCLCGEPSAPSLAALGIPFLSPFSGTPFSFPLGRQWMRGHLLAWTPGHWQGGTLRTAGGLAALPINHTAWAPEPMPHRWVSDKIWGAEFCRESNLYFLAATLPV